MKKKRGMERDEYSGKRRLFFSFFRKKAESPIDFLVFDCHNKSYERFTKRLSKKGNVMKRYFSLLFTVFCLWTFSSGATIPVLRPQTWADVFSEYKKCYKDDEE